jgi:hypothetical protein
MRVRGVLGTYLKWCRVLCTKAKAGTQGKATFFFFLPTAFFFGCQLLHLLTSFVVVVLFLVASATVSLIIIFVLFCGVVVA